MFLTNTPAGNRHRAAAPLSGPARNSPNP